MARSGHGKTRGQQQGHSVRQVSAADADGSVRTLFVALHAVVVRVVLEFAARRPLQQRLSSTKEQSTLGDDDRSKRPATTRTTVTQAPGSTRNEARGAGSRDQLQRTTNEVEGVWHMTQAASSALFSRVHAEQFQAPPIACPPAADAAPAEGELPGLWSALVSAGLDCAAAPEPEPADAEAEEPAALPSDKRPVATVGPAAAADEAEPPAAD